MQHDNGQLCQKGNEGSIQGFGGAVDKEGRAAGLGCFRGNDGGREAQDSKPSRSIRPPAISQQVKHASKLPNDGIQIANVAHYTNLPAITISSSASKSLA